MRTHSRSFSPASRQRGVVLFIVLIFLLILSLLGVTAARMQTVEERMARNDDNRQLGAQAAEAALRSAETGLLTGSYSNFGSTAGLYLPLLLTNGSPVPTLNWGGGPTVVLTYSGPALYTGSTLTWVPAATRTPHFVIEQLPSVTGPSGDISVASLNPPSPVTVYRVTAQGVGADGTSTTTLQSIVR